MKNTVKDGDFPYDDGSPQISRKCECASQWWIAKSPNGAVGVAWPGPEELMGIFMSKKEEQEPWETMGKRRLFAGFIDLLFYFDFLV